MYQFVCPPKVYKSQYTGSAHLISEDKVVLVDLLERKALPGLLVFDEVDGAVGPVGDELDHVKVVFARRLAPEVFPGHGAGHARVFAVRSGKLQSLEKQ